MSKMPVTHPLAKKLLGLALLLCLFAGGCSRTATTTTINADGSYDRSVAYTVQQGMPGQAGTPGATFHTLFGLPEDKDGVTYVHGPDDDKTGKKLTVNRHVAGGGQIPADIVLLSSTDKKPLLNSQVVVAKLPNGDVSYDETIKWVGPSPLDNGKDLSKVSEMFNKSLPKRLQSDKSSTAMARDFFKLIAHSMFGPPYPEFVEYLTAPEMAEVRTKDLFGTLFADEVKKSFPDLTDAEKQEIVKNSSITAQNLEALKNLSDPSNAQDNKTDASGMTPMFFLVSPPGPVVETNGLQTHDGKVYWMLYAMSASIGDVHLHLIAHPN